MNKAILIVFLVLSLPTIAQDISGCMDPDASNYNNNATINDFSCLYDVLSIDIEPDNSFLLPSFLKESSGLCSYNNLVWTHNDDNTSKIVGIDRGNGRVIDSIDFGLTVIDWEDIQFLNGKFYIGDFGNNATGIRSNLRIFTYDVTTRVIDTISFTYCNQFDFSTTSANQTNFDCEAFLVTDSIIYLFTKRWGDYKTEIHTLPNIIGTHSTVLKGEFNCEGLITGATFTNNGIAVVGYTSLLAPFMIVIKDYEEDNFLVSNKRRYQLNLPFHQVEAINYDAASNSFTISNEQFSFLGQIIPARLSNFKIERESNLSVNSMNKKITWIVFDSVTNHLSAKYKLVPIEIVNSNGQIVYKGDLDASGITLSTLIKGSYLVHNKENGQVERISIHR